MDNLIYKGTDRMNPSKCSSCGASSIHKYLRRPHSAIRKLVIDKEWKEICGKCAKKELGTKNKKDWERLHAESL